ncbi:coiled-coil domain-containing protein [Rickettsiales endosymbiont of Stachyamoeba lipophora]|uniref:hypothetical protein n=1 Tax=Rickettsiales endosymbiont of Stachyamoeba lipophora TaxID=2486578 RepID=UPI000F64F556|nr:hypothetical protein [Rickettsiales endosymbiont of Stachyamoeba lipophora]AZL14976.1 hypothetical protein EF513_00115 [Rickettsiales endosymbiont of Stachyamoeba lipophora]
MPAFTSQDQINKVAIFTKEIKDFYIDFKALLDIREQENELIRQKLLQDNSAIRNTKACPMHEIKNDIYKMNMTLLDLVEQCKESDNKIRQQLQQLGEKLQGNSAIHNTKADRTQEIDDLNKKYKDLLDLYEQLKESSNKSRQQLQPLGEKLQGNSAIHNTEAAPITPAEPVVSPQSSAQQASVTTADESVVSSQSSTQQVPVTTADESVVSSQSSAQQAPVIPAESVVSSQSSTQQVPVTTADGSVASPQALKAGKRDWLKLTLITAASILGVIGCTYLLGRFMAPKQTEAAVKTVCNAMGNIPNFALKALEQARSVAKPLLDKVSASQNSVITRS